MRGHRPLPISKFNAFAEREIVFDLEFVKALVQFASRDFNKSRSTVRIRKRISRLKKAIQQLLKLRFSRLRRPAYHLIRSVLGQELLGRAGLFVADAATPQEIDPFA